VIIKYRILAGLILIFSSFLVIGNFYIYQQQRASLIQTYQLVKQSEVNVLSQFAKESLITENYSLVEWFFNRWGKDRPSVVKLSIENKAGFMLGNYQRPFTESKDILTVSTTINLNSEAYKITLVSEFNDVNNILEQLITQLLLTSSLATLLLAVSIWYLFQQFAIYPLETEVQRRINAEKELKVEHQQLKQVNYKLADLASHDHLTGLRNRLNMERDIEQLIQQHKKHHAPYAVLMFDIDWFKKVNDIHGHAVGDFILIEVAKLLMQDVRQDDRVYRAGGEEFVIVLNRISLEDTLYRAEKIRASIENHPFKIKKIAVSKTISGGLYHSSLIKVDKVERVLKLVDDALYESKSKGRNQITNAHILDRVS